MGERGGGFGGGEGQVGGGGGGNSGRGGGVLGGGEGGGGRGGRGGGGVGWGWGLGELPVGAWSGWWGREWGARLVGGEGGAGGGRLVSQMWTLGGRRPGRRCERRGGGWGGSGGREGGGAGGGTLGGGSGGLGGGGGTGPELRRDRRWSGGEQPDDRWMIISPMEHLGMSKISRQFKTSRAAARDRRGRHTPRARTAGCRCSGRRGRTRRYWRLPRRPGRDQHPVAGADGGARAADLDDTAACEDHVALGRALDRVQPGRDAWRDAGERERDLGAGGVVQQLGDRATLVGGELGRVRAGKQPGRHQWRASIAMPS